MDYPGRDEKEMIGITYNRLARNHDPMLVDRCLGYLAASKNGLSEDEIIDILSFDSEFFKNFKENAHGEFTAGDADKIPVVVWSRLYSDLAPYLCERSADGTTIFNFFHRQLRAVAKEKYLSGDNRVKKHKLLAEYFMMKPYRTDKIPNLRKLSELPRHQARGAMFEELTKTLTDLWFISAKCSAGMYHELMDDYEDAMNELPGMRDEIKLKKERITQIDDKEIERLKNKPDRKDKIKIFYQFMHSEGNNIINYSRKPEFLIQQAYNSANCGIVAQMAEKAVNDVKESPLFLLKPECRPPFNPGKASFQTVEGHTDPVKSIAKTPDGKIAVKWSGDETLNVWNIKSGKFLYSFKGDINYINASEIKPDRMIALSGSRYKTLQVWDISTAECLFSMSFASIVESVTVKNNVLVVGESSGKVNFIELKNFKI
jgi:hypothetical protein